MNKNEIFFSENGNGLTATSANHVANMAKEHVQSVEMKLKSLELYSTSIAVIGDGGFLQTQKGCTPEMLSEVPVMLESISQAHALIAWLREAIKAKEAMTKEVQHMMLHEYLKKIGEEMPVEPVVPKDTDINDYIAELSVAERNRIYTLKAKAAVLGKFIHPDGSFSNARKELNDKMNHPSKVSGNGRDTIIYKYEATISTEDADKVFFDLQAEYRSVQAELNGINHELEKKMKEDFQALYSQYCIEQGVYENALEARRRELENWRMNELRRIELLKIIIPNHLKPIYDSLK